MSEKVRIKKCRKKDYFSNYLYRYSADSKRYDDPYHPKPSLQAEEEWWDMEVRQGYHKIFSIHNTEDQVIGFLHLFSFRNGRCETGITIFPRDNWRKGYGYAAYKQLEEDFLSQENLREIYAETSVENIGAVSLYRKLGYRICGSYVENGIKWLVMSKKLEK